MQKVRNAQYAAAGVQVLPGMRLNVRSNVRLPDSEAGTESALQQEPYYAAQVRSRERRPHVTVPARAAGIFLCAIFLLFGGIIINRASQRAEIAKNISLIQEDIKNTYLENSQLTLDVAKARDSLTIGYQAVQTLKMEAATDKNTISVVAPETRPAQTYSITAAQESSPFSALEGMISGSR